MIELQYVKMEEQLADDFTKAVGHWKFIEMSMKLGLSCVADQ